MCPIFFQCQTKQNPYSIDDLPELPRGCDRKCCTLILSGIAGGEVLPVIIPSAIQAGHTKSQHGIDILCCPPSTGFFQACLYDKAVSTFNFAGADRASQPDSPGIIDLIASVTKIAVSFPYWSLRIRCGGGFQMRQQGFQHLGGTVGFQFLLPLLQPCGGVRGTGWGGFLFRDNYLVRSATITVAG